MEKTGKYEVYEIDKQELVNAKNVLNEGGLIAFPTDTFYALGGNALNRNVIKQVFELKRRNKNEPLPIFVNSINQLSIVAASINKTSKRLVEAFWPGQLTVILNKTQSIPHELTAGLSGVGVRIPDHNIALKLLKMVSFPLIATSANVSGNKPCINSQQVAHQFGTKLDLIITGQCNGATQSSTVVDARKTPVRLIRSGAIRTESITSVLNYV